MEQNFCAFSHLNLKSGDTGKELNWHFYVLNIARLRMVFITIWWGYLPFLVKKTFIQNFVASRQRQGILNHSNLAFFPFTTCVSVCKIHWNELNKTYIKCNPSSRNMQPFLQSSKLKNSVLFNCSKWLLLRHEFKE